MHINFYFVCAGNYHPKVGIILTCIALMYRHKAAMERSSSLLIQEVRNYPQSHWAYANIYKPHVFTFCFLPLQHVQRQPVTMILPWVEFVLMSDLTVAVVIVEYENAFVLEVSLSKGFFVMQGLYRRAIEVLKAPPLEVESMRNNEKVAILHH